MSVEESPQLSHGYSITIMMTFFPSVWKSIMDPLVDEYITLREVGGLIDSEVREKANRLIRLFIIEVSASFVLLAGINFIVMSG